MRNDYASRYPSDRLRHRRRSEDYEMDRRMDYASDYRSRRDRRDYMDRADQRDYADRRDLRDYADEADYLDYAEDYGNERPLSRQEKQS